MGKLTVKKVESLTEPGDYNDGDGLYLRLRSKGVGSWFLRTAVHGRKMDVGLGSLKNVSLAEARREAATKRAIARAGGDPRQDRTKRIPTFKEAAETVHKDQVLSSSRNGKHKDQWINTLAAYAFPTIGHLPVDKIEQADILRVLRPIWQAKPETARRVRQRLKVIFAWTRAASHRQALNPVAEVEAGLPAQRDKTEHHPALPWPDLPDFMIRLRAVDTRSALALRFTILTYARSGEVRGATWSEIDLDAALWTIPAERMKAGVEHRVPLTAEAVTILKQVQGLDPSLVFPGTKPGRPMSDMTLTALLKRMKRADITVHGFRSSFRDWVSEATDFSADLAEHCLAHRVGNAVQRAYARSDLLEKRRDLLEAWQTFCLSRLPVAGEPAASTLLDV